MIFIKTLKLSCGVWSRFNYIKLEEIAGKQCFHYSSEITVLLMQNKNLALIKFMKGITGFTVKVASPNSISFNQRHLCTFDVS